MSVIIDPRRLDAVLFDLGDQPDAAVEARLRDAGVRVDRSDATALVESANRLAVRPGRCAVVASTEAGVTAARAGGFALVVAIDSTGALDSRGADAVVSDVREIGVRTGDRRMSELPDGLQALELTTERQPAVFYDFDGTLSEIVEDPDSARLVDGAADALTSLSAACPVAILSGRDLADVRERIGLPGLWYAGSHGFELTGPDGAHHQNPRRRQASRCWPKRPQTWPTSWGIFPVWWWSTSDSVSPCTTATPPVTASARWPRRCEPPGSELRFASRRAVKSSSYVQISTGTREKHCAGCSITSATTKDPARCCRSTSATTSPTRTPSTRSTTTASRSWCVTATTGTAPPPPATRWTIPAGCGNSPSGSPAGSRTDHRTACD